MSSESTNVDIPSAGMQISAKLCRIPIGHKLVEMRHFDVIGSTETFLFEKILVTRKFEITKFLPLHSEVKSTPFQFYGDYRRISESGDAPDDTFDKVVGLKNSINYKIKLDVVLNCDNWRTGDDASG